MEYSQGMLRPVIFVGCGGAGVKTVARARQMVGEYLEDSGWEGGIPRAWKFLGIDPNLPFEIFHPHGSQLPSECFVSLGIVRSHRDIDSNVMALFRGSDGSVNNDLIGWRPNPSELQGPPSRSPGRYRVEGRMMGIASYAVVQKKIEWAFNEARAGASELLDLSQHLGISSDHGEQESKPIVIVLGSIVGGFGSAIMLDIIDLIKQTHIDGAFPTLIGYTGDIFGAVETDGMATNGLSALGSLTSQRWIEETCTSVYLPAWTCRPFWEHRQ